MQKLYEQYTDLIRNSLQHGERRGELKKGLTEDRLFSSKATKHTLSDKSTDEALYESLKPLSHLSSQNAQYDQNPGAHPDFTHIKSQNTVEHHYITSLFIDIKGSTALFRRYNPLTVAIITTTIQKAALHTCWHFGGYIQRFHGDGLLAYFGGRNITMSESVKNSIDAASFFTHFVKNDLRNVFNEQGVENIYTRIGIDTGEAEDVLWHLAGIGNCSEITTCSLHTSLAAHMQSEAPGNGIMVGDNVKNSSSLQSNLFSIKRNSDGSEERYIYRIPNENFNYTQWIFNWEAYIKNHLSVSENDDGTLFFTTTAPVVISQKKNYDYLEKQVDGYKPYLND